MRLLLISLAFAASLVGAAAQAQEYVGSVSYPRDGYVRSAGTARDAEVARIQARLAAAPTRAIVLEAHTADGKSYEDALMLSTMRANSVRDELVRAGVAFDRITFGAMADVQAADARPPFDPASTFHDRVDVFLSSRTHVGGKIAANQVETFTVRAGGSAAVRQSDLCPRSTEQRTVTLNSAEPDLIFELDGPGSTAVTIDAPFNVLVVLAGPGNSIQCSVVGQGGNTSWPSLPSGEYRLFVGRFWASEQQYWTLGDVGPFTLRVARGAR